MAYNKEDLIKKSLAAIKKNKLIFIEEVVSFLPCHLATFYRLKCEECEDIQEALQLNKVDTKIHLRKKWKDSDVAALQIMLYRLCSSDKELERMTMQKIKSEINSTVKTSLDLSSLSDDELDTLENIVSKSGGDSELNKD